MVERLETFLKLTCNANGRQLVTGTLRSSPVMLPSLHVFWRELVVVLWHEHGVTSMTVHETFLTLDGFDRAANGTLEPVTLTNLTFLGARVMSTETFTEGSVLESVSAFALYEFHIIHL